MLLKLDEIRENSVDQFNNIVVRYATSDSPIENLNAVLFGTKYKCKEQQFVDALVKMLDSPERFFGTPLKLYVQASLDVLDVQHYTGDDNFVIELIQSGFETI